jgi:hypothetical protein
MDKNYSNIMDKKHKVTQDKHTLRKRVKSKLIKMNCIYSYSTFQCFETKDFVFLESK